MNITPNRRELLSGMAAGSLGLLTNRSIAAAAPAPQLPSRGDYLVRNGYLLTMDPKLGDIPQGDVHVRNGQIVAVGPSLSAPGAEVIDARTMIVLPGLIETHWHMWETISRNMSGDTEATGYFPYSRVMGVLFSPEDNARGVRLALAEALNSGLTTVHNWSHNLLKPAYADAELAVHREVGGRALFSYGYSRNTGPNETLPLDDVLRVKKQYFDVPNDGLITLGIASRGPENNTIDICRREFAFARANKLPITIHIGTSAKKTFGIKALDDAGPRTHRAGNGNDGRRPRPRDRRPSRFAHAGKTRRSDFGADRRAQHGAVHRPGAYDRAVGAPEQRRHGVRRRADPQAPRSAHRDRRSAGDARGQGVDRPRARAHLGKPSDGLRLVRNGDAKALGRGRLSRRPEPTRQWAWERRRPA